MANPASAFQPLTLATFNPVGQPSSGALVPASNSLTAVRPGDTSQKALHAAAAVIGSQMQAALPTPPDVRELTRGSTTAVNLAMARDGVFSKESQRELREQLAEICNTLFGAVSLRSDQIGIVLQKHHEDVAVWRKDLLIYSKSMMDAAATADGLTPNQKEAYPLMMSGAQNMLALMNNAIKDQMNAESEGTGTIVKSYQQLGAVAIDLRAKQIEQFKLQLSILQDNETHQATLSLKVLEASMEQQNQLFDQLQKISDMDQQAYEAYRKAELADAKEQNSHSVNMREADVKAEKNRLEASVARFTVQLNSEVSKHAALLKAQVDQRAEMEKSRREQIIQNGQTSRANHSSCVIQ